MKMLVAVCSISGKPKPWPEEWHRRTANAKLTNIVSGKPYKNQHANMS